MASNLTRRKFLETTGTLAAGCISGLAFLFSLLENGDIENIMVNHTEPGMSYHTEPRTACTIGVGDTGFEVISLLRQNPFLQKPVWSHEAVEYVEMCVQECNPMRIYHFQVSLETPDLDRYHPLFLVGSCDDSAFWSARDFVKSFNPYFLLTCASSKKAQNWPDPSENETVITFEALEDTYQIARIIHNVYAAVAVPGMAGLNDFREVLGGSTVLAIEYRSSKEGIPDLKEFFDQHSETIRNSHAIACIFSFRGRDSVEGLHYETAIQAILPLAENRDFLLGDHFSATEDEFEVLVLCQTAKLT
jgi:hypothetical protein